MKLAIEIVIITPEANAAVVAAVLASLKVSITLSFIGTAVSETFVSNDGIGYLMMSAGSSMKMPRVFAGLLVIGAMAMAMYEVFAVLERQMADRARRGAHVNG